MNVFELIKEKLDKHITETYYESVKGNRDAGIRNNAYHNARDIVDEVAKEYNNGWIPCSERLPDKAGKYIVTVKNLTGYWIMEDNVFVCDYQLDDFIFSGWEDNEVIAWQPLPAPYEEGDME